MADEDIHHLCVIYDELPLEKMAALGPHLLPFADPLDLASNDHLVYTNLKAIRGDHERLQCMAEIYSWLLPRSLQTTWALYNVHRMTSVLDAAQIGVELVRKVRSVDKSAAEYVSDAGNAWHSTIMTTQGARSPSEYIPISINVWHGLPFVAIHIQDMTGPYSANIPLLISLVGDLGKCFYGFYSSLASARSEAANYVPDKSE
ncbi:hypothetical protein MRX96_031310 [Rhipicephalus microplus]